MRVLVFTCDPYYELLEGFSALFNRHWGPEQQVDVLGFTEPNFDLPSNFVFHSAGRQSDFPPKTIYDPFASIINSFPEDYFTMFLEDTFLIRDVDKKLVEKAKQKIINGVADSIAMFWGGGHQYFSCTEHDADFLEYSQEMTYRVNAAPQMMTKDLFFRYMKPGMGLHQYEIDNIESAKNNGATLLCGKKPLAPWINILRHGKFNSNIERRLAETNGGTFGWNPIQVIEKEDEEIVYSYKKWSATKPS